MDESAKVDPIVVRKYHHSIPTDFQIFRDPEPPKPPPRPRPAPAPAPAPAHAAEIHRPLLPPRLEKELFERRGPACSGWWAVLVALLAAAGAGGSIWSGGLVPARLTALLGLPERSADGLPVWQWGGVGGCGILALLALGGLAQGRVGSARVLSLFGRYRGSVRRTGLVWISPLVRRRRVDVRLRHWRSEPMAAVDAQGVELRVVVLVVWHIKDTARALFAVDDHAAYLREQIEAVTARVVSQLPADSFGGPDDGTETLRDTEAVGATLSRMLAAECRAVGIEVFSARPARIEYAPDVAAVMKRRQVAAIDARHRDSVLTSVLDAVDDTVGRLTQRGLVSLDDYERKALVKDLTVAFYTARGSAVDTH
ncbi:SPFH domain-containing protein [Streptomyces sp. WAC07061]|uniref:SPFH domain-containing protein n=1 Tax=Streptomyces sp. WAC07061 TaxID=2487410 RepID=UPI0021AF5ABF|nr:SPFH domain-containing protein [Streptomyces sp. WAC07061]